LQEGERSLSNLIPANDNAPRIVRSATDGKPIPVSEMIRDAKPVVIERKRKEAKAMKLQTSRIGRRAAKGFDWDGAANDNVSMPAIKWLRVNRDEEMLKPFLAYVQIEAAADSGAELRGNQHAGTDLLQIDQRTWIDPKSGEIKYKGERRLTGIEFTGREHAAKSKDVDPLQVKKAPAPVPRPFGGDRAVIECIDAKPKLVRLRAALGPLLEPFEDMVLHAKSLESAGWSAGASNNRAAMAVGGSLLMMGLAVIAQELGEIRHEERAALRRVA
jgi:hypothetical protein